MASCGPFARSVSAVEDTGGPPTTKSDRGGDARSRHDDFLKLSGGFPLTCRRGLCLHERRVRRHTDSEGSAAQKGGAYRSPDTFDSNAHRSLEGYPSRAEGPVGSLSFETMAPSSDRLGG
jgi:hypothetical protein